MKRSFQIFLAAIAISFSVAGCNGNSSTGTADTNKVDSSSSFKSSAKTDTVVKADTSAKKDTVSKSTTQTTVVKKSVVKKN